MSGLVSALKVLRKREKARANLWDFCQETVLQRIPHRVKAPPHEVLCEYLQQMTDDPDEEGSILIVLMPPGSAKTLFAARALPAWIMGRQPGAKVLMMTNSMPLAEANGKAIRDVMAMPFYKQTFPHVGAPLGSPTEFKLEDDTEFKGVGIGGAVLGRRSDWLLIDDPISGFEEAQSESQLAKIHEAYEINISTRCKPGARIVLICQRLARNDLAGYIQDNAKTGGKKVRVLRMPMICDDAANDPLHRAVGEPLWPEYFTKGMLIDAGMPMKPEDGEGSFKWRTLYQQKPPSDEGSWVNIQDVQTTPMPGGVVKNENWRIYIGVDLAYTVNSGDYTVFVVVAFEKRTGAMHIMDVYRERVDQATSTEKLLDMVEEWKPHWVGCDADGLSKGYMPHLKTRAAYRNVNLAVEMMPLGSSNVKGGGKEIRAGSLRAKIKSGLLHVDRSARWAAPVLKELAMFPNATGSGVDDIVDALGVVARKTNAMMISHAEKSESKRLPTVHEMNLGDLFEDNEWGRNSYKRI